MFTREKAAACATIRLKKGVPNRAIAQALLKEAWKTDEAGCYGLTHIQREWYERDGDCWRPIDEQVMEDYVRNLLGDRVKLVGEEKDGTASITTPSGGRAKSVLGELRSLVNVHRDQPVPGWLPGTPHVLASCEPCDIITFQNGLLHIPTDQFISPIPPWWYHRASTGYVYEREPECGTHHWDSFLASLGPFQEQLDCLYEMMGLLLVPDTSYQTLFWLLGPPRSGKGTLVRVIKELVGRENVCFPSLHAYGDQHGRWGMIGKTLAVSADMRFEGGRNSDKVVGSILSISGEDEQSIPRKYLPDWTGQLNIRSLFVANALPDLVDATQALRSRSIILQTFQTIDEKIRDPHLSAKLLSELPAIVHLALAGLRRLRERGRFLQPECGDAYRREMEELANPISVFVEDCCRLDPNTFETTERLYDRYKAWCINEAGYKPKSREWFARDLNSTLIGDVRAGRANTPDANGKRQRGYKGIAVLP